MDRDGRGHGLGRVFLGDAVLRTVQAAEIARIGATLAHTICKDVRWFHERRGFRPSSLGPMILMLTVMDVVRGLGVKR